MSLLEFFARVRGTADCNKMGENLNKAREDFRREMNALSEKSISNASARIASVSRCFELRGSLIRHLPLIGMGGQGDESDLSNILHPLHHLRRHDYERIRWF